MCFWITSYDEINLRSLTMEEPFDRIRLVILN
jgi:hypothetical protein